MNDDDLRTIIMAVETLRNLVPDMDTLSAVVEAHYETALAVETCEEHCDAERGEYDADTKQNAREDAQNALQGLVEAIEGLEPPTPVEQPPLDRLVQFDDRERQSPLAVHFAEHPEGRVAGRPA